MLKKDWFTSAELANLKLIGIPTAKDKLIAKALREGWEHRPRSARGGGYEYHLSSLPLKARLDLDKRRGLTIESKEISIANTNNTMSNQSKFAEIATKAEQFNHSSSQKAVMIAKGREAILNKITSLKTPNTKHKEIINHFITAYNQGEFKSTSTRTSHNSQHQQNTKEDIYNYIPSLSYRSITRFMKAYKEQGVSGLLPNLEAKKSTVLTKTEYKSVIVGNLTQYPHSK